MAQKDKTNPASTSAAYDEMRPRWDLIDTLLGGTEAMRSAGSTFLPQHPEEEDSTYRNRLELASLLNMTEMTLDALCNKPFSEPAKPGEDIPAEILEFLKDIDLQGNNIDVFSRSWFRTGLAKAFSHVLVEHPRPKEPEDGRPRTLADDRAENLRPYWVHVPPENVLFAMAEVVNGGERLTHVRIYEETVERDGFIEVTVKRVRVLEPGYVWVYRQGSNGKYELEEEYAVDMPEIPLVTFYTNRTGLMQGKPPLTDLAHMNVAHWQSSADQRHVLTVSRFPMLAVSGALNEDDEGQKLKVGPNQWLHCPDPSGRFYYVEHTGAAIEAGAKDLAALEEQMASYGAEFLRRKPGGVTATQRVLDSAEATTDLQAMALDFQDALARALYYTAQWMKKDDGGTIEVNTRFNDSWAVAGDLNALASARKGRDISRKAYLNELRRRGILDEDYDEEADKEQLDEELMSGRAMMFDLDPAQQGNEEDEDEDGEEGAEE